MVKAVPLCFRTPKGSRVMIMSDAISGIMQPVKEQGTLDIYMRGDNFCFEVDADYTEVVEELAFLCGVPTQSFEPRKKAKVK